LSGGLGKAINKDKRRRIMGLKTFDEYYARLKKLRRNMYMGGEKIDRTDERIAGQLRVIRETG
jgi:hypothetical protein